MLICVILDKQETVPISFLNKASNTITQQFQQKITWLSKYLSFRFPLTDASISRTVSTSNYYILRKWRKPFKISLNFLPSFGFRVLSHHYSSPATRQAARSKGIGNTCWLFTWNAQPRGLRNYHLSEINLVRSDRLIGASASLSYETWFAGRWLNASQAKQRRYKLKMHNLHLKLPKTSAIASLSGENYYRSSQSAGEPSLLPLR